MLIGFCLEVLSPISIGFLREVGRAKVTSGIGPLLTSETKTVEHNSPRRRTRRHHLHVPRCHCACSLSWQTPARPQHFGSVFSCSRSGAGIAGKRRRSCQDTLAAPASVIQEVVAYPRCSVCISAQDTAPRRAGSCWHTPDGRHGIGVQARSMVPVQENRRVSEVENQNTVSGTSTRLGPVARVCSNFRFRFGPLYCSCRGSFCKCSFVLIVRFSLDVPLHGSHLTECDWLSLSGVPREPKAPSSFISLPKADSGTPGNQVLSASCKTPEVCPFGYSFRFMQCGTFCSPAAFRLRNQQQSFTVGASRARRLLLQTSFSGTRCRGTRLLRRDGAHTLAGAGGAREPAFANTAGSAALRNGTDGATAAVESSEHKVASA